MNLSAALDIIDINKIYSQFYIKQSRPSNSLHVIDICQLVWRYTVQIPYAYRQTSCKVAKCTSYSGEDLKVISSSLAGWTAG